MSVRSRRRALGLLAALWPRAALAAAPPARWEQWQHLAGVFDLAGPRRDGRLLAAAGGGLFTVDRAGTPAPFAAGPDGYSAPAGTESYLALSPGLHVAGAGCDFAPDDAYVLDLRTKAPGVLRIDAQGRVAAFASVAEAESLNGIAFDTSGRFGHRLLVTGPHPGGTLVVAIDCRGTATVLTSTAPALEGGLAVAPAGFGAYGGDLVAPDEMSGRLLAISAAGEARVLADSGLPTGGDIGVESVGFVPPGFAQGGAA